MFKRFSKDEVSGHTQLKASVQRAIRSTSNSLGGLPAHKSWTPRPVV